MYKTNNRYVHDFYTHTAGVPACCLETAQTQCVLETVWNPSMPLLGAYSVAQPPWHDAWPSRRRSFQTATHHNWNVSPIQYQHHRICPNNDCINAHGRAYIVHQVSLCSALQQIVYHCHMTIHRREHQRQATQLHRHNTEHHEFMYECVLWKFTHQ